MGSIASIGANYLQSVLSSVLQGSGLSGTAKKTQTSNNALPTDNTQLSPYAQITTELQQLQQSNPTEYQQVTAQISTNLQTAAQQATASGNTTLASQLNQLANDFQTASSTGQLPNFQDLAQAASTHHHHHHHGGAEASTDSASSSTSASSATDSSASDSSSLSQLLAALQGGSSSQSDALNPMTIIMNTLSAAGISGTSNS